VKCRPALDHLGEIGAPLLLRFLSTSVGYHYLHELDYIHREMDDWFHVSPPKSNKPQSPGQRAEPD
jgi:rapamycin-insensitive companion of mTOR